MPVTLIIQHTLMTCDVPHVAFNIPLDLFNILLDV